MLKPLRARVNDLLAGTQTQRKPALRRASGPEALLATDLPFAAEADAVQDFIRRATDDGWRVTQADNGWLLLDRPVPVPDCPIPDVPGEAGCCLSILMRHPEAGDARAYIREVVRAQEAGGYELQRLCARLHGEFAAMLRLHQPLPGGLLTYLARACMNCEGREQE